MSLILHCRARQMTKNSACWHLVWKASHRRPMPFMATGEDDLFLLLLFSYFDYSETRLPFLYKQLLKHLSAS